MRRLVPIAILLALLAAPARGEEALKPGEVLHRVSKKHDRPYSLFIPGNYTPRASWPLVVSSHGLNGTGKGEINGWIALARENGFIVACPDMCSATEGRAPKSKLQKWEEDDEVVVSILEELSAKLRVNRRAVMITGFSGGGNPSYYTGLRHPDLFTHICTRGGNFAPFQIPTDEKILAAGRKDLLVYIYYGENDHPLILGKDGQPGQAKQAHEALTKAGYEHVKIEEIAGMGHQSRPEIAANWFAEFLAANKKMFQAGDRADQMLEDVREAVEKGDYRAALRELDKLVKHEERNGLKALSTAERERIDAIGQGKIDEAKAKWRDGDVGSARALLGIVARDFKGLPSGDLAEELKTEWEEQ